MGLNWRVENPGDLPLGTDMESYAMRPGLARLLQLYPDLPVSEANGYLDGIEGRAGESDRWEVMHRANPEDAYALGSSYQTGFNKGREHLRLLRKYNAKPATEVYADGAERAPPEPWKRDEL